MSFDKAADAKRKVVDPYDTPKETWQFVTVPDEDPLGKKFPNISLNKDVFEAGQTYKLPLQVVAYIQDRVKTFNRSCVRLLQPNADLKSINEVNAGTTNNSVAGRAAVAIDGSQIQTIA